MPSTAGPQSTDNLNFTARQFPAADLAVNGGRSEVIFIVDNVADWETLARHMKPGGEVVVLDSRGDGLRQMADYLAGRSGIDAIHLISHGAAGQLDLGTLTLDTAMSQTRTDDLASIGQALTEAGDLLLYGCSVGDASGQEFIAALARLTGADVAASSDFTGATAFGGDWDLEILAGSIETDIALSADGQQYFGSVLATFTGTSGNDTLIGTGEDDILYGGDGNDQISAQTGADVLYGELGNDSLAGFDGDDTLYGGGGNDLLLALSGNDFLYGDDGNDSASGGAGNDMIYGGDGNDLLLGQAHDDTLYGGAGDDLLRGGSESDFLYGDMGNDTLSGDVGNDTLYGGGDSDTLVGGAGNDAFQGAVDDLDGDTISDFAIGDSIVVTGADLSALNATAASGTITLASGKTLTLTGISGASGTFVAIYAGGNTTITLSATPPAPTPTLTSATYDAATGTVVVTGTDLQANGAGADIDASKLTLIGEGGATYTLTDTADVEIDSATQFTLTLSATDLAAANQIFNKAGTASTGGTTFNLAAADDWNTAAITGDSSDSSGNGVTVSNVAVPTLGSATYDAATGVVVVTGTGFLKRSGASNDIDVAKLSLSGEDSESYTLTTGSVEITSATEFTVTLNATDKAAVGLFLNKNGTSSTSTTTYNLAAAEDWAAGADAAVVVADLTGNGVTVSNVPAAAITSATYDTITGVLVVTGTGFLKKAGAANDIDLSKLIFTGKNSAIYTLTTATDIDVTSATSFTATLSGADKTAVDALFDAAGTQASDTVTYNLAAAEGWGPGGGALNAADLTGNGITVSMPVTFALTTNDDTPALSTGADSVTASLVNVLNATDVIDGLAGSDTLSISAAQTVTLGATTLTNVETITIAAGIQSITTDDATVGTGRTLTVDASASTAKLTWLGSAETDGVFSITGGAGADSIVGGSGNDTLHGGDASDTLDGGLGNDVLYGDGGDDVLSGAAGSDTLHGGAGNDIFQGSADNLDGDTIADFAVGDQISVTGSTDLSALNGTAASGTITLDTGKTLTLTGISAASGTFAATYAGGKTTITLTAPAPAAPSPDPVPSTPAAVTSTVDGATVQTQTSTDSKTGVTQQTITVPVISTTRSEDASTRNAGLADIPLGVTGTATQPKVDLTVSLPTGTGLTASGSPSALSGQQAVLDLIGRIEATTTTGSSAQTEMTGQGSSFLAALGERSLLTRTVVPTVTASGGSTTTEPVTIVISGGTGSIVKSTPGNSTTATALGMVIDTRSLPSGSTIHLDNIEFAAIVGSATITGGSGENYVVGDDAAQYIVLGADDDTLAGGGGNDIVGSAGGDDLLDGGSGNDSMFGGSGNDSLSGGSGDDVIIGGRSDMGAWEFYLGGDGVIQARHQTALGADATAWETVALGELDMSATGLEFSSAAAEILKSVALLYEAAFGRAADLPGLSSWVQQPLTLTQIARAFLDSDEWAARHGQQDDAAFVASLYTDVLGRAADAEGLAYWLDALATGGKSRADVLLGFAVSTENETLARTDQGLPLGSTTVTDEAGWLTNSGDDRLDGGAGNDLLVGGDGMDTVVYSNAADNYSFVLTAVGEVRIVDTASGEADIIRGIERGEFGGQEYDLAFTQADTGILGTVGLLYAVALGRQGDLDGLSLWVGQGLTTEQYAAGFAASPEFAGRYGQLNNRGFVEALYLSNLERDAHSSEIDFWVNYLGSHTRAELLGAWIAEPEIIARQYSGGDFTLF